MICVVTNSYENFRNYCRARGIDALKCKWVRSADELAQARISDATIVLSNGSGAMSSLPGIRTYARVRKCLLVHDLF